MRPALCAICENQPPVFGSWETMCRTCKDLWQTNYGSFAQSLTRDQLKGISLAQQAKARGEERIKVLVRLDVEAGDPVEA